MNRIQGWMALLIAAVLLAGLAGCGEAPEMPEGEPAAETAPASTPSAVATPRFESGMIPPAIVIPTVTPDAASATELPDAVTIAMIAKSSTNPVFLSARTGAEAAARELSERHGVTITIDWRTPPTEDGQVQAQRIAQAVNEGADAILISSSDAAKVTGAINDAVARGVPVMTFDSDVPESARFAFYGVDDIQTGQAVMRELAGQLGGAGRIAILAGNQNAPNLRRRVQGVEQEAANHPGIEIVGVFYHAETPQDAAAEVLRVMNAYPDIDGWAMIGGWPLFTTTLLTDLNPEEVKVVSVDALPAELPYIEAGIAPVLLAQPTYLWGYVSVEKIIDKLMGRDVPEMNRMELVRVTRENLGEWARQLRDWGFEDVPEQYLQME
ncbi:MAG: Autoinducer 2-binding protein LsrB precursor [candidate division BRC1 bacterium ADurb.BinA292]|nr:MAG: Autoinducer 2-binding protein LsrB precursor [candidate division BRC1 bacterium ADurb.BinA292]